MKTLPNLCNINNLRPGYIDRGNVLELEYVNAPRTNDNVNIPNTKTVKINTDGDTIIKLIDDNTDELLSLMRLVPYNVNGDEYYKVDKVKAFVRGQSNGIHLYKYCIYELDKPLISDKIQTLPGSVTLWKKMKDQSLDENFGIYVLNENTGRKVLFKRPYVFTDYEVWGWDRDFIPFFRKNPEFIKDAYQDGDISKLQLEYLKSEPRKIKDRSHIKLIAQRD